MKICLLALALLVAVHAEPFDGNCPDYWIPYAVNRWDTLGLLVTSCENWGIDVSVDDIKSQNTECGGSITSKDFCILQDRIYPYQRIWLHHGCAFPLAKCVLKVGFSLSQLYLRMRIVGGTIGSWYCSFLLYCIPCAAFLYMIEKLFLQYSESIRSGALHSPKGR